MPGKYVLAGGSRLLRWLTRALNWSSKWLPPLFSALAAIFGLLWEKDFPEFVLKSYPDRTGLFHILKEYIPILFVTCFCASGIFSFFGVFSKKTIVSLEKSLEKERGKISVIAENIESVVRGLLLNLSERLSFARGEPSRLTIYIHNSNGNFISFGRYSPDPTFGGKGRSLLPDDQGCISHAWHSDWCYEDDLKYARAKSKYRVQKEVYDKRRMKSVFFAVKRIVGSNMHPVAVLVVESEQASRFSEVDIKSALEKEEIYFSEIIKCLKDHIPDPQNAKDRGF